MQDQYGNAVPADLEVLPDFNLLDDAEREEVFKADWYEANRSILLADVPGLGGDDPRDVGLRVDDDGNLSGCEVRLVSSPLKRANPQDGFYHA